MKNFIVLCTTISLIVLSGYQEREVIGNLEDNAEVASQLSQIWEEYLEAFENEDIEPTWFKDIMVNE